MEKRWRLITATSALLIVSLGASVFAEDLTVEEIAERYEAQWKDVNAMRIGFRREMQTRSEASSYDACSWEMVGEKAKIVESRLTSVLRDPLNRDSTRISADVVSLCYYDGEKTREIAAPTDVWPLESFNLEDYESLRRQGYRASISNLNKHWRFWYSCPIPRYFSIPTETGLISLPSLVEKYDARVVKRMRSERGGDELVQIEIRNDAVEGNMSEFFKSWALYVSLNVTKNYAIAGYQLSVTLNREPEAKVISGYTASGFKEFPRGIWLPTTAVYREHSDGIRSSLTKIAIRGVSINVPSTDFDTFKFLPNMVVQEEIWPENPDENERPQVLFHIWGDDAPSQTFENEEAFRKYYGEQYGLEKFEEAVDPRFRIMERRRSALLFIGACVCLGAFVWLTFYTRRAMKKDLEEENS